MKRIGLTHGCALLIAALAGCDQDVEPREGVWLFDNGDTVSDSCRVSQLRPSEGEFEVTRASDGQLIVDPQDGTEPFQCRVDGSSFDCPERFAEELEVGSFDASVEVYARAEGAFDDERSATGRQDLRVECTGPDCDSLAASLGTSVPCELSVEFEADFVRGE